MNKTLKIGDIIKNHRINYNYTQKEVSKIIGMDYSNYSKIERNLISPSLFILSELCVLLNIDPIILLGLSRNGNQIIKQKDAD